MTIDGDDLSREFHETRRGDHEGTLAGLDKSFPDDPATTREGRVDRADIAYATLHEAGKLDGPFEYPSVRAARLQREAMAERRPATMRSFHWADTEYATSQEEIELAHDPAAMLAGAADGTVAIKESFSDNDVLQGSSSVTWLHCRDLEDAQRYVQQVGVSFSEPGPGEDDGKYWYREIYVKQGSDQIVRASVYGK